MYHREKAQEAFLVLTGECTLIVEGQERRLRGMGLLLLRTPDRAHHRGGGSSNPRSWLAVGARGRGVGGETLYTVCKAAARYGASVYACDCPTPPEAYGKVWAKLPRSRFVKYRQGWLADD